MAVKGIQKVEYSTDADWTAGTGTFSEIPIASVLKEGFSMGEPEEFITELANEVEELDGVKYAGTINVKADETTIPANNATGVVFKVTPESGDVTYFGGVNGCTIRLVKGNARTLQTGQWFTTINFTYSGADSDAVVKTTWP